MLYQRPIFATLAAFYCLGLGIASLYKNRYSKLNRLFAYYNFCTAIWNFEDYVVFLPDENSKLLLTRITGIGGCFFIPFVLHFIYELVRISDRKSYRILIKASYVIAIIFSFLYWTPLMFLTGESKFFEGTPGPLYPFFALFILISLFTVFYPLIKVLKKSTGLKRLQTSYVLLACTIGFLALCFYYLSFISIDLPWTYYPLQALVGSTFAYAIFKYDLIPVNLVLRRILLVLGIGTFIAMLLTPITYLFYRHMQLNEPHIGSIAIFTCTVGVIASLGPLFYLFLIKNLDLFQDRMTSQFTHELKTPLAAIESANIFLSTEFKKLNNKNRVISEYLEMIQKNTNRLNKLVVDILDLSRIKEKYFPTDLEKIDLKVVLQEVLSDFPNIRKRVELISDHRSHLNGNREGLKQIFSNLISNALKYCQHGKIEVKFNRADGKIIISIKDDGIGIEKKNLKSIFDPFFKVNIHNSHIIGSGLGLTIVKKWVELHKGIVWAESEGIGKGTTILITLPTEL